MTQAPTPTAMDFVIPSAWISGGVMKYPGIHAIGPTVL